MPSLLHLKPSVFLFRAPPRKGLNSMSWTFYRTGKPADVCAELDRQLEGMAPGQSRDEFAAAAPHIKGLVAQTIARTDKGLNFICGESLVKVEATGSGMTDGGEVVQQSCSVKIEPIVPNCRP